jgi:hypothetical protein
MRVPLLFPHPRRNFVLNQCPHCLQPLQFSAEQVRRVQHALSQLASDKQLGIKCPHCRQPIALDKSGQPPPVAAGQEAAVAPPPPPNLEWLQSGLFPESGKVADVPTALVLHAAGAERDRIEEAMESIGYQVVLTDSVEDALERMRFVRFSCVVFQASLDGGLEQSEFHAAMRALPMERRRYMFYILLDEQRHTLYDLEALACSANLVVNSADLEHLDIVLRKAIPAYEELFGPFLEELRVQGKR